MNKLTGVLFLFVAITLASAGHAQQTLVEFRIREFSVPEQRYPTPTDAIMDFVVEGRVRKEVNVGIAQFGFTIEIDGENESGGTLSRLRSSDANGMAYTGMPTTSTSGGAFAGLTYQYRYAVNLNASFNGMINISAGNFRNNSSLQEIGLIAGSTANSYLVPSGLIVEDPGNPESFIPAPGMQFPNALQQYFGANDQFTELYRFRYTFATVQSRKIKISLKNASAMVFSTLSGSGTNYAPVVLAGQPIVVVSPMYITIPECPPSGLSPMCVQTFAEQNGFLESWSTMCQVSGTCTGFPQFCTQDAPPQMSEQGRSGMDSGTLKNLANSFGAFSCVNGTNSSARQQFFRAAADTQGVIGPDHFLEVAHQFATVYGRNPANPLDLVRIGSVNLQSLFRMSVTDGLPICGSSPTIKFDPRVVFDETSRRWIAATISGGEESLIRIAVSETEDPTGQWRKYAFQLPGPFTLIDYDTLSVDRFGIYLAVTRGSQNIYMLQNGNPEVKLQARDALGCCSPNIMLGNTYQSILLCIEKEQLIPRAGLPSVSRYEFVTFGPSARFLSTPVVAADPSGETGRNSAWILASPIDQLSGVAYRKIQWFENSSCSGISLCGDAVTSKFFIASDTSVVETPPFLRVPLFVDMGANTPPCPDNLPSATSCPSSCLENVDHRIQIALTRGGLVWGARHLGFSPVSGQRAVASEWFELSESVTEPFSLNLVQSGRLQDHVSGKHFITPSIWTNSGQDVVMGLSIADPATGKISAGYAYRTRGDPVGEMRPLQILRTGEDRFGMRGLSPVQSRVRWGDYCQVSVDPRAGMQDRFWLCLLTSGRRTFFKYQTGLGCDSVGSIEVTCDDSNYCDIQTCNELHGSGNWRQWIANVSIPPSLCCRGATCQVLTSVECFSSGSAGALLLGSGVCNASGNGTSPCCFADFDKLGGVVVLDIFAFLNAWFDQSPLADVGGNGSTSPGLSDVFDFLNLWFAGGC